MHSDTSAVVVDVDNAVVAVTVVFGCREEAVNVGMDSTMVMMMNDE